MFNSKYIKIVLFVCLIGIIIFFNYNRIKNILYNLKTSIVTNVDNIFRNNKDDPNSHKNISKLHKESYPDFLAKAYDDFIDNVKNKTNYFNVDSSVTFFSENSKNLFIGHSGAVFFGDTMGAEKLSEYGYDVVSFGGMLDEDCSIVLDIIDKKYDNIIIFGSTNDLNLRSNFGLDYVDKTYFEILSELYNKSKQHLNNENGKIVFIKPKIMIYDLDHTDEAHVVRFNKMVETVNNNLEKIGFDVYDIPFDTTSKYSSGYIHYNNIEVFEYILKNIDNLYFYK